MRATSALLIALLLISGCRSADDAGDDASSGVAIDTTAATMPEQQQPQTAGFVPTGDVVGQGVLPGGETHVFDCAAPDVDSLTVTVRVDSTEAMLWAPTDGAVDPVRLERVESTDSARYENDNPDQQAMFLSTGQEATFVVDGVRYTGCTRNNYRSVWEDAKLDGVDFRALGNEPGWIVDVYAGDRFDVQWRYGERTADLPYVDPDIPDDSTTIFRSETADHSLVMTLRAGGCTDSMSGIAFPFSVSIEIDGSEYTGCGRPLH